MATPPPNSQRPQSFHPDFAHNVFMIVITVRSHGIIGLSGYSIQTF